jgi:arylsulfatase A-like enzyme
MPSSGRGLGSTLRGGSGKVFAMPLISRIAFGVFLSLAVVISCCAETKGTPPPNVLFFIVDDLNDWNSLLDPKAPIKTPNLERLAQRGLLFTRAYCVSAACNPSRVATLTGLRPSTSGVYGNKSDWRRALPKRLTLMQQFRKAGYQVEGAGKIFHHHLNGAFHDEASFDRFQPMKRQLYPPEKLNGAAEYGSRNTDWGKWPVDEQDSIDSGTVDFCVRALENPPVDRPLFLACGIFKPHSPFFAPAKYHETYVGLQPPVRLDHDWDDLPSGAIDLLAGKQWFWKGMMDLNERRPNAYQNFVRSYAACVAFADAQIGRVLDALDGSSVRDNTVVVLWSDHGFHLGEKNHLEKFALWEKSNRVPLIVVGPGVTQKGSRCDVPVDLSVLYPTLLELCGLEPDSTCDGVSAVPLLRDPDAAWDRPAVMTYQRGNHAVRSERWRYLRYADGSEELYDHQSDPNEWHNLKGKADYEKVIKQHRQWLPTEEAVLVRDLTRQKN